MRVDKTGAMTSRTPPQPSKDARAGRLAAALKANLKRRKSQARERAAAEDSTAPAEPSAGPPAGGTRKAVG